MKGSKFYKNQKVEHFTVLISNFLQKLVNDLMRSELTVFVLNGNWGKTSYSVPKTYIPGYNELYKVSCATSII